jgi:hypothetical protein
MKNVCLWLFLLVCPIAATPQPSRLPDPKQGMTPQAWCAALGPRLRNPGANEIFLTVKVDKSGKVRSFQTVSPKGLRLEKMKESSAAIKAMRFPARKAGHSGIVRVLFDCSEPATEASTQP